MGKWKKRVIAILGLLLMLGLIYLLETELSKEPSVSKKEVNEENQITADQGAFEDTQELLQTETEEAKPQVEQITITATGDCTFGPTQTHGYAGSVHEYYDNQGPDYFMEKVRPIFEKDDFTLVNLECALTNSEDRVEKEFSLKGKPEYTSIMTGSSIEGCSMGNNHTLDYKEQGLQDTKDAVTAAGLVYAWRNEPGVYTTASGKKIGFISVSFLSQAVEYQDMMQEGIASLKEQGVDLVIAACHWGEERQNYPTAYQENMAHNCIDWGADVVIGCHPHVIQGLEIYNGHVICYSLGNFCFGGNSNPSDKDTMIYQQTFTFVDGVLQQDLNAKIIPCTVSGHEEYNDYQPQIADGERKESILNRVREYSAPYSAMSFDSDGTITQN